MKFLHILCLLLVALVSLTSAQRCRGAPRQPNCAGGVNIGHRRGRTCRQSVLWAYDARLRRCRRMMYLGCGGNNNRWCTQAGCEQQCRRAN
ncbi:male accessory gland serine protease inhibitor-like [Cochliomyia hominivorax]